MNRRIMCIWFPHWPIQTTVNEQPEWKGTTVVLFSEGGRSGRTVVSRSQRTAAKGVKPGTPLAEAKALLFDAPSPHYVRFTPLVYRLALEKLAVWCQQFSPVVGLEHTEPPECLLLDVTGCTHLFGGEQAMVQTVVRKLSEHGFVARCAIADTIGAAWAMETANAGNIVTGGLSIDNCATNATSASGGACPRRTPAGINPAARNCECRIGCAVLNNI